MFVKLLILAIILVLIIMLALGFKLIFDKREKFSWKCCCHSRYNKGERCPDDEIEKNIKE